MDEGIDLIRGLWAGRTSYKGQHYQYECSRSDLAEVGRPVQDRIPIWVVAAWPRPRSMRRALRCDGVIPEYHRSGGQDGRPVDAAAVRAWLAEHGARAGIDLIAEGETPAGDDAAAAAALTPWAEAGCTWWLESRWEMPHHGPERMAQVRQRLAAGPPRPAG
jgi:hypothetical protein